MTPKQPKPLPDKLEEDAETLLAISERGYARIARHLREASFRIHMLELALMEELRKPKSNDE